MSFTHGSSVFRRAGLLLLALFLSGCGSGKGDVSGQVNFNGEPLPVGRVFFFSETEKKPVISAWVVRGKYTIKSCPAGSAKISIESVRPPRRMSQNDAHAPVPGKELLKGFESSKPPPELEELLEGEPVKYMPIPQRYANPETSELEYVVRKGLQTHNLDLTR